jgi:hypothetical protein
MCGWDTAIALTGLAVGTGTSLYSASQNAAFTAQRNRQEQIKQAASEAARANERARQALLEDKAQKEFAVQLAAQGPDQFNQLQHEGAEDVRLTTDRLKDQYTPPDSMALGSARALSADTPYTREAARLDTEKQSDARRRIAAIADLAGYGRAIGTLRDSSKLYNADADILAAQQRRSAALGQAEGRMDGINGPLQPDNSIPAALGSLGTAAISASQNKALVGDIKSVFG